MLSLNRKTDYALVALSYLASRWVDKAGPVSARQISDTFGLPSALLMNILKELGQAKVVNSTRGAHGGYELAGDPSRITLLEVVTAMQGPVQLTPCSQGLPIVGQGCNLSGDCPIKGPIRSLHSRLNRFLEELTLEDLAGDLPENGAADCGCQTEQDTKPTQSSAKDEIYQGV